MSDVKYVIGKVHFKGGYHVVAIMFPGTMVHADIADGVFGRRENVLSAGFVCFNRGKSELGEYSTYGKSESLKVKSRKGDSAILNRQLGPHYNVNSAQDTVFDENPSPHRVRDDPIKDLAQDIIDGSLS